MLKPGAVVRKLSCTRMMSFSDLMRDNCGRKELTWADSAGTMCMYTFAMMGGSTPRCVAFHLDIDRVKKAKEAADNEQDYQGGGAYRAFLNLFYKNKRDEDDKK